MKYLDAIDDLKRRLIASASPWPDMRDDFKNPGECHLAKFLLGLPDEKMAEVGSLYYKLLFEFMQIPAGSITMVEEWIGSRPVSPMYRFTKDLVSQLYSGLYRPTDLDHGLRRLWIEQVALAVADRHTVSHDAIWRKLEASLK